MRAGARELAAGLSGGLAAGGGFLALAFGLDFSFVTATVLAAVGGGAVWFLVRRVSATRGAEAPVPEDDAAIIRRGFAQADAFVAIARRVRDAELSARVGHIGGRLREMFTELSRNPDKAFEASEFVIDFLPRALEMVEHYVSLSARLEGGDERLASAAHTVNTIADAVKASHKKLFEEELTEFVAASRTLEQEIRLMHPTLAMKQKGRVHE